ncbi:MAG: hypothetical protein A2068_07490 [Ignavibacteria bacterium GWB2_35_6b]|nr:MAG: hypothetical protein A2068_07490 [Ignavibacteria bacterium GWB2_35_6b]
MDEKFDKLYQAETRLGKIFIAFSILSLFLGTLGLFGLVSFLAEQKKREIGIRKVLGASSNSISILISTDFLKLLIVSTVIALPISYLMLDNWLDNFAYRINVGIFSLIFSAAFTITVAISSVIFQAYKAARQNPATVLRNN